jgi:crotonobetainyl-CoA:carnitine CoA-transferase CaiB-like acyl-CoA transferase
MTQARDGRHGALGDVQILELGSMLAGPFVGTLLADFGAEVIKAEKPGKPDALREWPPHKGDSALWWKTMARGKRLITLDISKPAGRETVLELMARSDVVIENFKPGTMERWGFDPAKLAESMPRTVWVRVSGFGQSGPYRHRGGFATIAEGFSGLASFTGYDDRGPMVSAFPLGDYLAGIFGAFGAMVALHERDRSGRGQIVDVSLYEPLLRIIESVVVRFDQTGGLKPRLGNQMEEDVPRNVYLTADGGHIAISSGSERIFENLLREMGRTDMLGDARFAGMAARVANRRAIDAIVSAWMRQQTTATALAVLERNEVVAGRINDMAEVLEDPHIAARAAIATLLDAELGALRMPAPVPQLSATPGAIRWAGGRMGEHNAEVYEGFLGLDAARIAALRRQAVI